MLTDNEDNKKIAYPIQIRPAIAHVILLTIDLTFNVSVSKKISFTKIFQEYLLTIKAIINKTIMAMNNLNNDGP
jgi:hypothetical protein